MWNIFKSNIKTSKIKIKIILYKIHFFIWKYRIILTKSLVIFYMINVNFRIIEKKKNFFVTISGSLFIFYKGHVYESKKYRWTIYETGEGANRFANSKRRILHTSYVQTFAVSSSRLVKAAFSSPWRPLVDDLVANKLRKLLLCSNSQTLKYLESFEKDQDGTMTDRMRAHQGQIIRINDIRK